MYNAFGIVEGSDVRIAGVNAGTVTGLDINAAKRAVVTVELSGELGELGDRDQVLVRAPVADRRVLHLLRARRAADRRGRRRRRPDADIPAEPGRRRRSRTTSSRTRCASRSASA